MRLISEYAQHPGRCFFTGSSSTEDGVIDLDRDVDFEGRVYMRGAMAQELAALIGWHSPAEFEALETERDNLVLELERAREALAALEDLAEAQRKVDEATAALAGV